MKTLTVLLFLVLLAGCRRTPAPVLEDESAEVSATVTGVVRDGDKPVAKARVRFKGLADSVLTDADGRFLLPRPSGSNRGARRVTAWKEGFLIAGTALDDGPLSLLLTRLPDKDIEDYAWVDPAPDKAGKHNCANCHAEIYREWSASGHARSATNRRFLNLYEGSDWEGNADVGWSLLSERPLGSGVCASCHAPTQNRSEGDAFDIRAVRGVASLGVHCDYCHKITGLEDGTIGLTHGRFILTRLRPKKGQLFLGPLDDVDRGEDAYSAFYKDSKYCASCHEGIVFGVKVYETYSEWRESPAGKEGKQCQSCHMSPTGKMTNIAPGKGGIERDPQTLGSHRFFAGSQLDMLRRGLKLATKLKRERDGVHVQVELRADGAGHRVPTGFIDRQLILAVEPFGPGIRPLKAQAGPSLPPAVGKELSGRPGQLYAKLLKDAEGNGPLPFWRAEADPVDTRLVPGKPDVSTFVFPAETERVQVRLIHRRFWDETARVKKWPNNDLTIFDRILKTENAVGTD
jgi:hypothetical protein